MDEVLPQEPFSTNQVDFDMQFDEQERFILNNPNHAQQRAFERW